MELVGKRALVIGAGFALGRVVALALAGAGADVAVASATTDGDEVMAVRRTRRGVEALGRRAVEYAFDTTLGQNVQVSTRQVAKEMGGLDILVNAQDAPLHKAMERTSDSEWARTIALNLGGVFAACRAAVREMTSGGIVLNVCPALGATDIADAAAYAAARYGVLGLTRALAAEFESRSIRVNALVVTAADIGAPAELPAADWGSPIPTGQAGLASELGPLAVDPCSTAAASLSGRVLGVAPGSH